jgi:hypothetical protein
MPRQTDRQLAADALHRAFLIQLVAEAEATLHSDHSDTEDGDSGSDLLDSDDNDQPLSHTLLESLASLYTNHYNEERRSIKKSGEQLHLLLTEWKHSEPGIFRSYLRVTPACFDKLVEALSTHPVFHNKSSNLQMSVEHQVAIALYRFGHYGNAASTMKVALWAGVGYGTVRLVTRRVMQACCDEGFRRSSLCWPDDAARERAKAWVAENSCDAWRNGWLMVDGSLVPLYARPAFYGNVFFDRKSNYSMNVQVIKSTPSSHALQF